MCRTLNREGQSGPLSARGSAQFRSGRSFVKAARTHDNHHADRNQVGREANTVPIGPYFWSFEVTMPEKVPVKAEVLA